MGWVRFCQGLLASIVSGALIGWFMLERSPECANPADAQRPLDLTSTADAQHLDEDLARVAKTAEMFGQAVGRMPIISDSPDAIEGRRDMPMRARAWCETTLLDGIAATHAIDRFQLQGRLHQSTAPTPAGGPAL